MSSLIGLVLGLFFLFAAWTAYRRTSLDETRDRLFDLRERIRAFFSAPGRSLDDPAYAALRDYLNGFIRFAEDARFVKMIYVSAKLSPHILAHLRQRIDLSLRSNDPSVVSLIDETRGLAVRIIQAYLFRTSTLAWALVILVAPAVIFDLAKKRMAPPLASLREAIRMRLVERPALRGSTIEQCAMFCGRGMSAAAA